MARAIWKSVILADSNNTVVVEGNHYFPRDSINHEHFKQSQVTTTCSWKGEASYFDVIVGDEVNEQAAWYYANPLSAANNIKDYVAFWKGIQVEE